MNIYAVCTGADYGNIGDVVLRRGLLRSFSGTGDVIHAYVGDAPAEFLEAMYHGVNDVVSYADLGSWARSQRSRASGRIAYFGKPGEMLVGPRPFLRQGLSAWHAQMARRRGVAILAGGGLRSEPSVVWPYRAILSCYDHVAWRDSASARVLGIGTQLPDWAFARGALLAREESTSGRGRLTISLRSKTAPSEWWLDAVAEFARDSSLALTVMVQVQRDRERGRAIAAKLNAEFVDWNGATHLEQERRVRAIFSQSALVLSNRLHALIMGMTEGAAPLCAFEHDDDKVQRHFDVVDLSNVARTIGSAAELQGALGHALGRRAEVSRQMAKAAEATDAEIARIKRLMAGKEDVDR